MDQAVDILHPLASVKWHECREVPVCIGRAQAVWLKDKIYLGGATVSGNKRDEARLYVYTPATDTWDVLDTPVYHFALTTYHSQLVLVGGWEYTSGLPTNKLWTLSEHGQWRETLPPLPTPLPAPGASAVSHGDYLLVIGIEYPLVNNKVYVYNGHQWATAQHPPQLLYFVTSTIFSGRWYLMGGTNSELSLPQETCVYSASLDSLIASCQFSAKETSQPRSAWKRIRSIPIGFCHPSVFGNMLIAVGGLNSTTTSLCVYSSSTQSWVHVGEAPITMNVATPCAVALPSNELMVVNGQRVFKIKLQMVSFNPDSFFDMKALNFLEKAIPVMSIYTQHIQDILGLPMTHVQESDLINYCVRSVWQVSPTWNNLLHILHVLKLDDLAQQIESYLSGAAENLSLIRRTDGDAEMGGHLRLRDDTILQLKQEGYAMQKRIKELTSENDELKHRLSPTIAFTTDASWNLRCVDVRGEMSAVICSSHDQQIRWPGFGLRLLFQAGCLPAGIEQCTVNIKVSIAGQYEFPENSHLVSAIFWFRCETVKKFTRPITVEIQHCAKPESTKLHFVRAVCCQKQLPYSFKQLPGGIFTNHSSNGVIELNSFSGVGITQEGSEDREYCSQLFYLAHPNSYQIYFVVTWNLEAHLTIVKEEYGNGKALLGLRQIIEFESDAVTLDIPMEGVVSKGWKITPLMRPVVTKKYVDNFTEGKVTPHCQLKAEVSERAKKVSSLKHQVKLEGVKYPHNIFIIDLPAKDPTSLGQAAQIQVGDLDAIGPSPAKRNRLESEYYSTAGHASSTAGPSLVSQNMERKLSIESDHSEVCSYLKSLENDQIMDLGGTLGLSYTRLQRMKHLPSDMVAAWLRKEKNVTNDPTWKTLIEALEREGQVGIVTDIETERICRRTV